MERLRERLPQEDQPQEEYPEGGIQRLVGNAEAGLVRQYMRPDKMRDWFNKGWTEHRIRLWCSLRNIKRDEDGAIIRSTWTGLDKPQQPQESYRRGTEALQRRLLHVPRICRPQVWLPHETPIKKPEL
eukprot:1870536-Pyramimonas_sp.AAC.1